MTSIAKKIPCPTPFSDHIYKEVDGVKIPLRVWPVEGKKNAPWLFWIHGGGFTGGKHWVPNQWVIPAFRERGYHVVSVAYRFSPQVAVPGQVDDLVDAHAWCLSNLPSILGPDSIQVNTYATGGDSAGGTYACLMGHLLSPAPAVVVDVFGAVDFTDDHYYNFDGSKPKHELQEPLDDDTPEEVLAEMAKDRDPKNAIWCTPWAWELPPYMTNDELKMFWGTNWDIGKKDMNRMATYQYLSSNHILMWTALKGEQFDNKEDFFKEAKRWSSLYILDEESRGRGPGERREPYPPTFFLHGDADGAVRIEQSKEMLAKLEKGGVETGHRWCPGGPHSFENAFSGPEDEGWHTYIVPCMDFVDKHLGKGLPN